MTKPPPYGIGSPTLNGLSKLVEEIGELNQVLGKIMGLGSLGTHWDGTDLTKRAQDEIADVIAAANFFIAKNGLDNAAVIERSRAKLRTILEWDEEWAGR